MRLVDYALAWLIVLMGALHCVITFVAYPTFGFPAVWFFGSGVALILGGLLNVLRVRHAAELPILRLAALGANFLLLAVAGAATILVLATLARNPQIPVVLGAVIGETILSWPRPEGRKTAR